MTSAPEAWARKRDWRAGGGDGRISSLHIVANLYKPTFADRMSHAGAPARLSW
ncbi:hypothetical protein T261_1569 [Streptomyces lydicus]|nr:hypothetical protein T261_1569 [Streptomyces lydicus]